MGYDTEDAAVGEVGMGGRVDVDGGSRRHRKGNKRTVFS